MRKKLRRMDLANLRNKKKVLGKFAQQPRAKRYPKLAAAAGLGRARGPAAGAAARRAGARDGVFCAPLLHGCVCCEDALLTRGPSAASRLSPEHVVAQIVSAAAPILSAVSLILSLTALTLSVVGLLLSVEQVAPG